MNCSQLLSLGFKTNRYFFPVFRKLALFDKLINFALVFRKITKAKCWQHIFASHFLIAELLFNVIAATINKFFSATRRGAWFALGRLQPHWNALKKSPRHVSMAGLRGWSIPLLFPPTVNESCLCAPTGSWLYGILMARAWTNQPSNIFPNKVRYIGTKSYVETIIANAPGHFMNTRRLVYFMFNIYAIAMTNTRNCFCWGNTIALSLTSCTRQEACPNALIVFEKNLTAFPPYRLFFYGHLKWLPVNI